MTDRIRLRSALLSASRRLEEDEEAAARAHDHDRRHDLAARVAELRGLANSEPALDALRLELFGTSLEKYATETAQKIASQLVADAMAAGYWVSVWEGEGWALKKSRDRDKILEALASTDHDVLHFWRDDGTPKGARVGWAMLIWQNDCDVISDNSDNPATEALLAPATALANQLQGEA